MLTPPYAISVGCQRSPIRTSSNVDLQVTTIFVYGSWFTNLLSSIYFQIVKFPSPWRAVNVIAFVDRFRPLYFFFSRSRYNNFSFQRGRTNRFSIRMSIRIAFSVFIGLSGSTRFCQVEHGRRCCSANLCLIFVGVRVCMFVFTTQRFLSTNSVSLYGKEGSSKTDN